MEIKGQIEDIIYCNETNSYTVCNVQVENNLITAVGNLPFVGVGDVIVANGKFVTHNTYGEQFKVDTFEKVMPDSTEQIEKYLGSGIIKGIGPVTARKIIDKFGDDTIYMLRFEPYKLSEISGITNTKATQISEAFNNEWGLWQIVMFLQSYGISVSNAARVYKAFGINAIEAIKNNPYTLVDILYGVDFKEVDKMALKLGVDYDSTYRIASAIKYALILASKNGHTCVLEQKLVEYVSNLLSVEINMIQKELDALNFGKEVYIENDYVFLKEYFVAEENVAKKLLSMCMDDVKSCRNLEDKLKNIESTLDIELSNEQKEAIQSAFGNRITIITGGPGTGKTTIIKTIIKLFEREGMEIALCAPTRKGC